MVAGWIFAAWQPAAMLVAQLLSGMCMSSLEGDMDASSPPSPSPSPPGSSPRRGRALSVALVTVLTVGMVTILA
jgi:hypothetical protein